MQQAGTKQLCRAGLGRGKKNVKKKKTQDTGYLLKYRRQQSLSAN